MEIQTSTRVGLFKRPTVHTQPLPVAVRVVETPPGSLKRDLCCACGAWFGHADGPFGHTHTCHTHAQIKRFTAERKKPGDDVDRLWLPPKSDRNTLMGPTRSRRSRDVDDPDETSTPEPGPISRAVRNMKILVGLGARAHTHTHTHTNR